MPLFADLTGSRLLITTRSEQARRYFNQGLVLTYGFNHAGAVRSFREAQRLDPGCAMCWWGEALALGPNINAPMDDRDRTSALAAMDRALALRAHASPLEQALIDAIARRYSRDAKADRAVLDAAYADAMLDVARRFPNDDDVAVLAAEAAMDTSPWNYWEADKRTPVGRSGEAVALIEKVLARHPENLQAAHLYIHLMENSADPRRAEAAADRLAQPLAPSAGHLVHMPAHIYALTGRYADAMRVNVAAARSDEGLIRRTDDHSLVRYGYYRTTSISSSPRPRWPATWTPLSARPVDCVPCSIRRRPRALPGCRRSMLRLIWRWRSSRKPRRYSPCHRRMRVFPMR
jgi:tetratricopeptide (TPR) repeat protein